MKTISAIFAFLVSVFLITTVSFGQPRVNVIKSPQTVTLEDLAFISGHSRGEVDGGIADEEWSRPIGDTMMGMYCYVKDGRVKMYEMMAIEQTANGPVLRLKHYNAGLQAWEEKTKVWDFPLVRFSPARRYSKPPTRAFASATAWQAPAFLKPRSKKQERSRKSSSTSTRRSDIPRVISPE